MMWIAIFTFFLFIGYFIYGIFLEKNWKIDIFSDQSDWQEDENIISHFGLRYVQIAQMAVFLSFEALISVVYGYIYGLTYVFWLILGTTFFGGALSYYGGMYALRNHGFSINYIIKQKLGNFAHIISTLLLLGLITLLLGDALNSFLTAYSGVWNLPENLLFIYCGIVAIFFCFCTSRQMAVILSGVGIFAIITLIILLGCSKWQLQFVEYAAHNFTIERLKYAYPLSFFIVAMGSVNCLQGLQASLLAPMVKNEKAGRRIFFGASVLQAFFLILLNVLLAAWNPNINNFYFSIMDTSSPYIFLQNMAYGAGGKKAALLMFALAMTLFLSFVGVMARLAHNLISETKIDKIKLLSGILTLLLIILPVYIVRNHAPAFPYIVIYAQIAGLFSCFTLMNYLKAEGKKYYHIVWPALLVGGALLAYIMLILFKLDLFISDLAGFTVLLLPCCIHLISKHKENLKQRWEAYKIKRSALKEVYRKKQEEKRLLKEEEKHRMQEEKIRQKEQKALEKKQKADIKKQEKENKKKASLALLTAQDETEGESSREQALAKEISSLQAERVKIELRVKEIEKELEKEQSKRLLVETSESVVKQMEKEETSDFTEDDNFMSENSKQENLDLTSIIDEVEKEKTENLPKFDFNDETEETFEFITESTKDDIEDKKVGFEPTELKPKKKRNRKKKKNNKNQEN